MRHVILAVVAVAFASTAVALAGNPSWVWTEPKAERIVAARRDGPPAGGRSSSGGSASGIGTALRRPRVGRARDERPDRGRGVP